ncbi:hypothetical protein BBP40_011226, partial [Aspergillus hancockii]
YDESSWKETDVELVSLFSHEMVHSFTLLDSADDGYDNGWYVEHSASGSLSFIPSTSGISWDFRIDILGSQQEFYNDWYAELIPYMRGSVYLLRADSRLRKATGFFELNQNSPLDGIVVDMAIRWRRGDRLQARDWLEYLHPYLGDVSQEFQNMLRGKVLALSGTIVINEDCAVSSSMHEILEFGFRRWSGQYTNNF